MTVKNLMAIVDEAAAGMLDEQRARFAGVNVLPEYVDRPDAIVRRAASSDIVLLLSWKAGRAVLQEILQANPRIEWVHTCWAGVDGLVFPALKDFPLVLTNSRGVFAEALAEFTLAACLYFAKDFPRLLRNQRLKRWEQFEGELIAGKTLGIFGYGEIGKSIARRAKLMGMRVIAAKKRLTPDFQDPYVDRVMHGRELPELCRQSDFVAAAAPLTVETRGIFNAQAFEAMQRTAVFINVGRGPVVNEANLVRALSAGIIRGAALDVFEHEPLEAASPLWSMPAVLISPHCADRYAGWLAKTMDFYVQNLERFLKGQPLQNIVDVELGY